MNSVFVKYQLNLCTDWVWVILLLQILNTRYFFGSCSALQFQQYTLQRTAFLLATLHSDRTKCPSPPQASKCALYLELPSHQT